MKIKLIIGVIALTIALSFLGCTDEDGARKTLVRNNYRVIEIGDYDWLGGSKDDVYKTEFTAIAPNGDTVTGTVTSGWFKGNTIRLDN